MAARKFLTPIDMMLLEIRQAISHLLASNPGSPVEGQTYHNTTDHTHRFYNGTAWVSLGTLDQITAPAADVSLNSHKLTSVTDPSSAQDAATKSYVDSQTAGARDVKDSVRVATAAALPAYTRTGNVITASANGALAAVDGVTLVANDRLLVKDGAAGSDNGIYTLTTVGTGGTPYVLTRATDADASSEVTAGLYVWTEEGTANADTGWLLTTNNPITLNTTALTFTQVSALGQITAGAGLTKTGGTLDVGAGTGISVAADSVAIDTAVTVDKTTAQTLTNKTLTAPVVNSPTGIVKGDVGLGNVDNTADTAKPVSTAQQTALDGKQGLDSDLTTIAGLTATTDNFIVSVASAWASRTPAQVRTTLNVPQKYAVDVGDGSSTSIVVTHNLGTLDVHVQVFVTGTTGALVECDVQHTTTNTTTLVFAVAPASAAYRCIVIG